MLHTKYQGPRSCGFRKEDFFFMVLLIQLIVQFRIWPCSESRHSVIANYTSAAIFKNIFWLGFDV